MNKHTQNPWHVGMRPGPIIYGPQGEQVADLSARMVSDEETKANARLVVTAPEMLELLREFLTYHETKNGNATETGCECVGCRTRLLLEEIDNG